MTDNDTCDWPKMSLGGDGDFSDEWIMSLWGFYDLSVKRKCVLLVF